MAETPEVFTFLAPTGAQEVLLFVRLFVCPVQVCLELSFFIFVAQIFKKSAVSCSDSHHTIRAYNTFYSC